MCDTKKQMFNMPLIMDAAIVDLTAEPKERITTLPSELLHIIFGYLFPTHQPDLAFEDPPKLPPISSHTLFRVAQTGKRLRVEVNQWALHFLRQHVSVTHYKVPKTSKLQAERKSLHELLKWCRTHCAFCGKKSVRNAILMNGTYKCCATCDKEQWPDKITKTDAKKEFDLKDHHLLPHQYTSSASGKLWAKHTRHLPKLRYGTYISSNVPTTMFLRAEVKRLAELNHGDADVHMKKKELEKEVRKKRRGELSEKKKEGSEKQYTPFQWAARRGRSIDEAFEVMGQLWQDMGGSVCTLDRQL